MGGVAWWFCKPGDVRKVGLNFSWGRGCDLHRNYGKVVILLSLLCNYDNSILKLYQKKSSYLNEGWLFIGRFKVGGVPGMSAVLVEYKSKSIKIHEYIPGAAWNYDS